MKRIFVLMLAICLCLCGCVSTEPQIDPDLIKIEIIYSDSQNITFDVVNNSKDKIEFGSEYYIEYHDGENWVPLEEKTETFFDMMARILDSGEKMNFSYDIMARYGEISSGKYRVYKDINLLNEDGMVCGNQRAFAEFDIVAIEK